MDLNQLNKHIRKSQTIRNEATGFSRELLDEYRQKVSEINGYRELSREGKQARISKLKEDYERKAMELSKRLYNEDKAALDEARKGAEKLLTAPLEKVDDQKRKLFTQKADELEARVLFSTNTKDASDAIHELTKVADEPALAAEVKPKVMELSQKVISQADSSEALATKKQLGNVYESVSNNALPVGGSEAKDVLNHVEATEQTPMFSGLVERSFQEISPLTSTYVNRPTEYDDKHGGDSNE